MIELIKKAVSLGAELEACISGGKDSQAMVRAMISFDLKPDNLVHCDLGEVEWPQSLGMCEKLSVETGVPLVVVKRKDGRGLLDHWKERMKKLKGTGKPFWSSMKNRYCTSDMKRDPSNVFYRGRKAGIIISCEGIRAEESPARAKKSPLQIREKITSKYYDGMTVEQALENYRPDKRLGLTWYPIFNFTIRDVWKTEGMTPEALQEARDSYQILGVVPAWWPFHPAYVFGNERVSCMICIVGSCNDVMNGARYNPKLYQEMKAMELESGSYFRQDLKLSELYGK